MFSLLAYIEEDKHIKNIVAEMGSSTSATCYMRRGIRFKMRRDGDLEISPIFRALSCPQHNFLVSHGAKVGLYFAGVVWQWNL